MDSKRLLLELASLPILPLGVNFSSRINRKILIPIQVFFLVSYIFNVGATVFEKNWSQINSATLLYVHWILEQILNIVCLLRQRRKIRELMMKMVRNMPQDLIKSQCRRSFRIIIGVIFIIALSEIFNFRHLNWTTSFEVVHNFYNLLVKTWHTFFIILSITFYLLQYNILNTFLSRAIQCLEKSIQRQETVNFKKLYTEILILSDIKEVFDDNMCVFPFIWFSTTFFTVVNTVFSVKNAELNNILDYIDYFKLPTCVNVVLLMAISIIDNTHTRQQRSIERVNSILVMKDSSDDAVLRLSTIFALESLGNKKVTALKLVNLDRQFLLTFISAFVTFNALFLSFVN